MSVPGSVPCGEDGCIVVGCSEGLLVNDRTVVDHRERVELPGVWTRDAADDRPSLRVRTSEGRPDQCDGGEMSGKHHDGQANRADLAAQYASAPSPTVRDLLRRALGTELANGYTTAEQADELAEILSLDVGHRLLDLGAGRGWPGAYIAEQSGCRLVSTDLTWEAVAAARHHVARAPVGPRTKLTAANGTALPFRDAVFDGVVHADVLC